jgi:hypothetical protein
MDDDEQVTPEEIAEMFEFLLENKLMEIIGFSEDGEPLYRFTEDLMAIPEFMDVHEAVTNEILFSIWNKGFIEMNPVNEDGDWNIRLNNKSFDHDAAYNELEEDEYVLFSQLFHELKDIDV